MLFDSSQPTRKDQTLLATSVRNEIVQTRLLAIICAVASGVMMAGAWLPPGVELEFTPDSGEYEAIATNLRAGLGYTSGRGNIAVNRSPLYPVMLAALFNEHTGAWHERIIGLHRCLAFFIGSLLVLYAYAAFGPLGTLCGVLAAILVSVDDELTYAGSQLLTELPATAFLTVSLLAAHWSARGTAPRELLMAVVHIGMFMTRSALVFCGIGYGVYLIYLWLTGYTRDGFWRVLFFGLPCVLAVFGWSAYLWIHTGQIILLTSTGMSNMAAGLNPEHVAASQGWTIPRSDGELEAFWTMAPGISTEEAIAAIPLAAKHPWRTLRLTVAKFKIAFNRTPIGVFFLGMFGIALQFCAHLRETDESAASSRVSHWIRQMSGRCAYFMAFCCCTLAVCGFSHPLTKAVIVAATLTILLCRVSVRGTPYAVRELGDSVPPILFMVCFGFILMTLISFGLPRFTRPFLPPLYLSATLCIPLAVKLRNATNAAARLTG